jgi:hypothetical protein
MTDQIAHLIEQAATAADTEYAQRQTGYSREDIFLRIFAKLIVRECAEIAKDCDVTEYNDFREGISQQIKQHFGIDQ